MALFEVVLEQRYFNQQVINRWNYVGSGTPAAVTLSYGLANAFGVVPDGGVYPAGSIVKLLQPQQSVDVSFTQLTVFNVYDPTDFYSLPFVPALNGSDAAGTGLSPTTAFGFRTNRVNRDIRRGTKRFVGVTENAVGAGGVISGGYLTSLAGIAEAMSENLTYDDEGNTLTYQPVIVSKQRYDTVTGLPDDEGTAYRYYPTLAEQDDHWALGIVWEVYTQTRTQASRQYGKGS